MTNTISLFLLIIMIIIGVCSSKKEKKRNEDVRLARHKQYHDKATEDLLHYYREMIRINPSITLEELDAHDCNNGFYRKQHGITWEMIIGK